MAAPQHVNQPAEFVSRIVVAALKPVLFGVLKTHETAWKVCFHGGNRHELNMSRIMSALA